jgi:hypothetical protein
MTRLMAIFCLISICAVAAVRNPSAVHQGAGAQSLITKHKAAPSTAGLMPSIVVVPPKPVTFLFTATAYNWLTFDGTTWTYTNSEPSTMVFFVRKNHEKTVTIALDPEAADGFNIQWGRATGELTNIVDVGNVTNATIRIIPPPLTNVVITVTGSTNWTMTNPPASSMFFTGKNLTISKRYF